MKKHLLIEKAFIYDIPQKSHEIVGYQYSVKDGFWINKNSKIPMMFDEFGPRPSTKKEDIETGEDRKSE